MGFYMLSDTIGFKKMPASVWSFLRCSEGIWFDGDLCNCLYPGRSWLEHRQSGTPSSTGSCLTFNLFLGPMLLFLKGSFAFDGLGGGWLSGVRPTWTKGRNINRRGTGIEIFSWESKSFFFFGSTTLNMYHKSGHLHCCIVQTSKFERNIY